MDLAIVFVHGFGGHFERSFENEDGTSWFKIIEGDADKLSSGRRVDQLSVFSVDYRDAFASEIGIDDIATQIAGRQELDALFQDHNHIWFVAHSLGGLVLKRVLLQLQGGGKEAYLDRILGVSFLGVPSQGAALADFAKKHDGLAKLLKYFSDDLKYSDKLISELTTVSGGNSFLEQLEQDWLQLASRRAESVYPFVIACVLETRPENKLTNLTVVPRLYASTSCTGPIHPINSAHRDLV